MTARTDAGWHRAQTLATADAPGALEAAGGCATRNELVTASSQATLERALRDGLIARAGRGHYVRSELDHPGAAHARARAWSRWHEGPSEDERRALAARLARARGARAALGLRCAAAAHGWALLQEPDEVELVLPPGRRASGSHARVQVRRAALTSDERRDHVTAPLRTVIDCAARLERAEALAVADSALRSGMVGPSELFEAGLRYRGYGAAQVRWVTATADAHAANPFESALRACIDGVPGLSITPQVEVSDAGFFAHVDLADTTLRLVVEADSYEFHGSAAAFAKDRCRYVELTVRGWTVLPFGFSDVLRRPRWVRSMVEGAVLTLSRRR